jgi:ectoine hydroxylase-related dioxygenase (phytanoyl-CoA dioxygenase family)
VLGRETITAWFSFNDSTVESGCVRYIPGSHKTVSIHDFRPAPNNLAPAGQTVRGVDESKAVDAVLRAGEVVFHHESVVHGSQPNRSGHPRVGFSIHYCAPHVRETRYEGATAMLLRGRDTHGYWGTDPEPKQDYDPDCIEAMLNTRKLFLKAANRKVREGVRS